MPSGGVSTGSQVLLLGVAVGSELHIRSRGACCFPGHFRSPKPPGSPVRQRRSWGSMAPSLRATPGLQSPWSGLEGCSREEGSGTLRKARKKRRSRSSQGHPGRAETVVGLNGPCCPPAQPTPLSGHPQFSCPWPWVPLGQSSRGAGVGPATAPGTGCMREVTILRGKEGCRFWGMRQHVSPECTGTFRGQSHQAHVCVLVCPAESGTDRAGASSTQ